MNASKKRQLLKIFEDLYPDPQSELNFKNEYQLVVCVMLSAQSTDKKVNEISPELFARFPSYTELAQAKLASIEKIIRPINYYITKAKHLKAMAAKVVSEFKGKLPRTHEGLTSLPGVGNKTANVVLSELKITPAFPVDTHVFRVAKRLGLANSENRDVVEGELTKAFPPETWRNLHHWLIFHGRRVCIARRPKCDECAVASLCPSRAAFI